MTWPRLQSGHAVTRMDALFGVFRYARLLSSPPTATDADTNDAVMTDWRIVRVTGPLVHSDILSKVLWFVDESIEGVLVKTIRLVSEYCCGVAVNASETLMVVAWSDSVYRSDELHVYSLPDGELLRTIGVGGDPGQFANRGELCFGRDDTIVFVDSSNDRLQEFTPTGEYKRSIAVNRPYSVCVSNSGRMIGMGDYYGAIQLLDYENGTAIRSIVVGPNTSEVTGVRFTHDDAHILVVDDHTPYVSMFTVADGVAVSAMCRGLAECRRKLLCLATNGDIIVADDKSNRICVFDVDGAVLRKQFRCHGEGSDDDGEFKHPSALACVNNRLYVLCHGSLHVQVFE